MTHFTCFNRGFRELALLWHWYDRRRSRLVVYSCKINHLHGPVRVPDTQTWFRSSTKHTHRHVCVWLRSSEKMRIEIPRWVHVCCVQPESGKWIQSARVCGVFGTLWAWAACSPSSHTVQSISFKSATHALSPLSSVRRIMFMSCIMRVLHISRNNFHHCVIDRIRFNVCLCVCQRWPKTHVTCHHHSAGNVSLVSAWSVFI